MRRRPALRRGGLARLEALLLSALLGVGWLALAVSLPHLRSRADRSTCADNLRRLGVAAIQYVDDKRFFPHVGSHRELDGGTGSNATTKVVRTLVWFGYHDDPEGFICPASRDAAVPIADADVRENMRLWTWRGLSRGDSYTPPLLDGRPDPALDATTELSYGWTRRAYNSGTCSPRLLAADRAQASPAPGEGNHADGVNVLHVDGTVRWVVAGTEEAGHLAAGERDDGSNGLNGSLAVHAPTRPSSFAWRPDWLALVGPPTLLALVLLARHMVNTRPQRAPSPLAHSHLRLD